nr:hypothetical protein CFP56_63398 [Quercus suber]POE94758.1 hypothetical protein CFP56_16995 [Quercus suber]
MAVRGIAMDQAARQNRLPFYTVTLCHHHDLERSTVLWISDVAVLPCAESESDTICTASQRSVIVYHLNPAYRLKKASDL